jgi:hypothetical protein
MNFKAITICEVAKDISGEHSFVEISYWRKKVRTHSEKYFACWLIGGLNIWICLMCETSDCTK